MTHHAIDALGYVTIGKKLGCGLRFGLDGTQQAQ
jgi:hypothetical protein